MESYYTSHTEKKGDKSVKVYKKHVSKKSLEVTLEQCNALHEGFPTKIWIYTFTPKKALEMEGERLVKRYGIKNSKPDEKFIKTIQNTIYSNCGLH